MCVYVRMWVYVGWEYWAIVSLSDRYSSSPAHVNDRTTLFMGGEERQYHADNRLSAVVLQISSPCRIEDLTYELQSRNSIVTLRFSLIYSAPAVAMVISNKR